MPDKLCQGKPPEWWEPTDQGARLALTLCRACPFLTRCPTGDPTPHGVIRAAVAYGDTGKPLPVCPCGYPVADYTGGTAGPCTRCRTPDVPIPDPAAVRRRAVLLLVRDGACDRTIAAQMKMSRRTVKNHRYAAGIRRPAGHTATLAQNAREEAA